MKAGHYAQVTFHPDNTGSAAGPEVIQDMIATKDQSFDEPGMRFYAESSKTYLCPERHDWQLRQALNPRYHQLYYFEGVLLDNAPCLATTHNASLHSRRYAGTNRITTILEFLACNTRTLHCGRHWRGYRESWENNSGSLCQSANFLSKISDSAFT